MHRKAQEIDKDCIALILLENKTLKKTKNQQPRGYELLLYSILRNLGQQWRT